MSTPPATARPSRFKLHPAQRRTLRPRLRLSIRDASLTDLSHPDDASGRSANHFWKLEPSPLILTAAEWSPLDEGLRQRARLVNALLVDLYHGQHALRAGILPPEVVLSDPFYRRPCLGLDPERASPATLLRFDLIRTPAGWRCAQTRANTPIGLSYAVQNRRFMTQESGGFYRSLPAYRSVINFPLRLLDALKNLAPGDRSSPSIIVLTAGPGDAFYSEHSFLARKMGLPLARGDDLLVLDDTVYFKTISGLERVDVIYRRLNDAHIDPVVFSTDRETAGIPGLLQSIRAGRVAVANSIGSGLAESLAIEAYLPGLARFYLGEKLLLPAPETYSCGDADRMEQILDQHGRFSIRPAHEHPDNYTVARPVFHRPLLTRDGLDRVVRQNPYGFVARAGDETLTPEGRRARDPSASFCLSAFVVSDGRHFETFPGGLVRLGGSTPPVGAVGESVDTVVFLGPEGTSAGADAEVAEQGPPPQPPQLGSRAAENLFWLGRYVERAEATARMSAILEDVALEEIPARDRRHWLPVWRGILEATGHSNSHRIDARKRPQDALGSDLAWRLTLDSSNPGSVVAAVGAVLFNAAQLRDTVSPEAWRLLARLRDRLETLRHRSLSHDGAGGKIRQELAAETVDVVLEQIPAFQATAERTMLHDAVWHFLRLGVCLERAIMTCSALRHALGTHASERDNPELSALLRMLGSQDAYRRLYQSRSHPLYVAEFFLRQPDAPHGIFHLVQEISARLARIRPKDSADRGSGKPEAMVDAITRLLLSLEISGGHPDAPGARPALGTQVSALLERLHGIHSALSDCYFSHQERISPK